MLRITHGQYIWKGNRNVKYPLVGWIWWTWMKNWSCISVHTWFGHLYDFSSGELSSLPIFRYLSTFCGFFVCFTAFGFISLLFIFWLILVMLVCLGHLWHFRKKQITLILWLKWSFSSKFMQSTQVLFLRNKCKKYNFTFSSDHIK